MNVCKGPSTGAELTQRVEADPDRVAQREAREREHARRRAEWRLEQARLLGDLKQKGVVISDVWDLVNTAIPYPKALPVLVSHLTEPYHERIREGIMRALAVKDSRPIAWDTLLDLIRGRSLPQYVADAAMVAISAMANPKDLTCLIDIIKDETYGSCRIFLVRNLMRSRKIEARQALLKLADDPYLRKEIARRLKLKDPKPIS